MFSGDGSLDCNSSTGERLALEVLMLSGDRSLCCSGVRSLLNSLSLGLMFSICRETCCGLFYKEFVIDYLSSIASGPATFLLAASLLSVCMAWNGSGGTLVGSERVLPRLTIASIKAVRGWRHPLASTPSLALFWLTFFSNSL